MKVIMLKFCLRLCKWLNMKFVCNVLDSEIMWQTKIKKMLEDGKN